jgi:hypothetical protein
MNQSELADLVAAGENDLVEFKREWHDLDSKLGKGHLARDVLAMANALPPGESGFIVFGIDDAKSGSAILGVSEPPGQEQVAQVLASYTNPVPRVRLAHCDCKGKNVSVLEVIWTEFHPYYATRDVETTLSTDAVYTRRAGTVGRLKPAELEHLIRAKDARVGKIAESSPLSIGFVELPSGGSTDRVSLRVENVTQEPVTGITATIDMVLIRYPNALYRRTLISNLTLDPGLSREFECKLSEASYYDLQGNVLRHQGFIWSTWIDLHLNLSYRTRGGVFGQVERRASLA